MLTELTDSLTIIVNQTKAHFFILGCIFTLLIAVHLCNLLCQKRLLLLGIFPRRLRGIPGIVCSPFLHVNANHLLFNCIPLLVLGNFILMGGLNYFLIVTGWITLLSGIFIWSFGQRGIHVGASAVVTGYWGFLVINSYHQGSMMAIILALLSIYYFAGIFYGIFPGKKGVSWDGHFFGLLAGIITNYLL